MKSYLEYELPENLTEDIAAWIKNQDNSSCWDAYYDQLNSDINVCEVGNVITSEQANFLRKKYLGLEREDL